eukprot:10941980-Ditylum_brightwellii.AAC.1
MQTNKSHLRKCLPDLATIPETAEDYARESWHLSKEECRNIAKADTLDPLQQEFLSWHQRLNHPRKKAMMILAQQGILPRQRRGSDGARKEQRQGAQ